MNDNLCPTCGRVKVKASDPSNPMRLARKKAGLSSGKAAAAIGCSTAEIFKYERGEVFPKLERALRMAEIYGCDVRDFIKKDAIPA